MLCESSTGALLPVCSLSRRVWHRMQGVSRFGCVVGRFQRSIDLLIDEEILALVTPEVGDGPFNVVVPRFPQQPLPRRFVVHFDEGGAAIGSWRLQIQPSSRLWEARPAWEHLSTPEVRVFRVLQSIVEAAARDIPASPLVELVRGKTIPQVSAFERALLAENSSLISESVIKLAGWGPGLTPSGDDYLTGVMLALWNITSGQVERPESNKMLDSGFDVSGPYLCSWIYQAAAPRTNRISRAFLKAARDGLADARWHALLEALDTGDLSAVQQAAQSILSFGATSGLDTLIGFLRILELFSKFETFTR